MNLNDIQRAIASHYSTHLRSVELVLTYMPTELEAGVAYVWQAEDWINSGVDEGTFCRPTIASYDIDIMASLVNDSEYSQEWLSDVVSEVLAAPDVQVGDDHCWPVRVPRLRIVQTENGQRFLSASISLSPISLEA